TLRVRQVIFPDLLTNGDHDSLPTYHRSKSQSQSHRYLHPGRNELGGQVDMLFIVGENLRIGFGELRLMRLLHKADGLTHQVHIVAEVPGLVGWHLRQILKEHKLVTDVVNERPQCQHRVWRKFTSTDVVSHVGTGIADHRIRRDVL